MTETATEVSAFDLLQTEFGVRPIINAGGPNTVRHASPSPLRPPPPPCHPTAHRSPTSAQAHSGSRMRPEALQAIDEASNVFLKIDELLDAAGSLIARTIDPTGAVVQGAAVCAGASAGMTLMSAAALSHRDAAHGADPDIVAQLPLTDGIPHELVVQASHQVAYDAAWMIPGARLVPVGRMRRTDRPVPDGGYLAEDCDCTAEEFEAAITDDTAAVLFAAECKRPPHTPPTITTTS